MVLGAPWPAVALAASAWIGARWIHGLPRILLLLLAPILLTSATDVTLVRDWRLPAGAGLAFLALGPLVLELGPGPLLRRAGLVAIPSVAIPALLMLTPPGALLLASDLATGAAIVGVAAGLVVATSVTAASKAS